ncbi:MAG: porin [Bacteroidetes bacterium]|nr:porin [Bacteroidota bacterium]
MDMIDTTKDMGKGILSMYKKFDRIYITGYLQPQFQWVGEKGAKSFGGGDFGPQVNNRYSIRRGRLRFDYARLNADNQLSVYFVFQFDGSEKGVFIRDFWGRVFENRWQVFSLTAGMFARPFGYEVNLASVDRESPERGRMSQLLMKTERDLGAMVSFEPRRSDHPLRHFKLDFGVFNGPGLSSPADYDSYKDLISRLSVKPWKLSEKLSVSGGLSLLYGGFLQNTRYVYTMGQNGGQKVFLPDSSLSNLNTEAPRHYAGADVQLKWKHKNGYTELRGEYWQGTQTATAGSTETPAALLTEPSYRRKFNGAFIYLLHNIVNTHHQLGFKYDWYDPNTQAAGKEIGTAGSGLGAADIRYNTVGFGYLYYINDNLKLVLWYDMIKNEYTSLSGYTSDVKDDLLTCRLQFRF